MTDQLDTSASPEHIPSGAEVPASADMPADTPAAPDRAGTQREALRRAHAAMAERRAAGWKPVILNPVERAKANPGSLKMAIKAHCWTCSGAGADAGVKLHVRDCRVLSCALWTHRPWQNAKGRFAVGENGELVAEGRDSDDGREDAGDEAPSATESQT